MLWGSDRGTVTAEVAIGIPAILGVIGLGLGALRWGVDAVTAVSVATESAISLSRGALVNDVQSQLSEANRSTDWVVSVAADRVCVSGSVPAPLEFLPPIEISRCVNA
ncbi:MAG: hypothetical protein F2574_00745 [Actinobacteria bacterium]|uniref:Unannotated protein n=1 Tax=freshwater metagenome TaxID=449393 RepID=A0A6J6F7H8_9ZZZZ|nr:hypothetical protein [Actinomycetota bacterium]